MLAAVPSKRWFGVICGKHGHRRHLRICRDYPDAMHSATWSGFLRAKAIAGLQKLAKLLDREAGVANNTPESEGVNWVVPWYGENACPVRHDDVFTLTHHREPGLLERAHRIKVIDARNLGQDQTATSTSRTSSPRS